ncbi:MAG: ABC transporter substrate-binding protein [Anaerolineae bacterium]|nr:ABC transporter substrate-binding protein [Anaerolineae bacterium]
MKKETWKHINIIVAMILIASFLAACAGGTKTAVTTSAPAITNPPVNTVPPSTSAPTATAQPTATPGPAAPVELSIGTTVIWDGNNLGVEATGWMVYRLLYDSIVEFGSNGTFIPGLAESWSNDSSGLVWTYKIRSGITFHDGPPCTAGDIAWSLNWMNEVGFNSIAYMWSGLFKEVKALDATTLQITTETPISYMNYVLSYSFVVPKSVWGNITDHDSMANYTEENATIGTGPYKFVEWVPDQYLILEKNENYWGTVPAIDKLIFQQYANEDAMVNAYQAGEIDAIETVPATAVETLQAAPNTKVVIWNGWGIHELTVNSYEIGTQPKSLADPAVRKAMEYATDREQINDVVFLGYNTPATTYIAPVLVDWHNSDVQTISFDIDKANQTLDEAGYKDTNGDGVREWSDGSDLKYRFLIDNQASSARLAEIIKNGFAQAGITIDIETVDYNTQLTKVFTDYDYDLTYWLWGGDPDPDFFNTVFACGQIGYWNDSGYCNADYDTLYNSSRTALNKQDRINIVKQMQEKIYNERPWIVLLYNSVISAYRTDRFTGFSPDTNYLFGKWSIIQAKPVE